ncbi:MAG TPA: tRNA modification GTPase, partial [Gemmataceae bacterium]|nr:tRNA modification GTPase [Gemmataceae bacterium]
RELPGDASEHNPAAHAAGSPGAESMHADDTIVALATPPGPGARAVVRLSGPEALAAVGALFSPREALAPRRALVEGSVRLPGVAAPLPADVYFWPGPHSYTGQDVAELHVLSSPPLVEALVAALLGTGARPAGPGEFTLRAFLAGKLDLTRAEAVHGVVEAGTRDELKQALAQLAGGVARPLHALRDDLLNLLADVEAGLDFAEEDVQFVVEKDMLLRLGGALAQVTLLGKQLEQRAVAGGAFRVVLAGRPNAGKSSLFNALAGAAALVSPEPGTTRDYLVRRLDLGGAAVELVDTPGWQEGGDAIESQAQSLGRQQAERADLVLLCLEAGVAPSAAAAALLKQERPAAVAVATKCDLAAPSPELPATSAVTGAGLEALGDLLAERARRRAQPPLAPSLSRCRHHVAECLANLRRAHAVVLYQDPPEILALELRGALEQLGEMVGAVYTDDLLDRIFSRFCVGK